MKVSYKISPGIKKYHLLLDLIYAYIWSMDRSGGVSVESLASQGENSLRAKKKPQLSHQSSLLEQIRVEKGGFCSFLSNVSGGQTEMEINNGEHNGNTL